MWPILVAADQNISGSFRAKSNVGSIAGRGKALNDLFKMLTLFMAYYMEPKICAPFLEPEIGIWSARDIN
jgi:hypothetical protein